MKIEKRPLPAGLYLVGVPIGTARDITLRALDTLASADVLVAEDTRSLRKLLDIHGVPLDGRRIRSLHDHSRPSEVEHVAQEAKAQAVAYASEAGMPLLADPGFELVRAARAAGAMVTSAPGPTALTTALSVAGLPTDAIHFTGFLPSAKSARRTALEALKDIDATLAFYESPKRIARMLEDAADMLGADRKAALCRELTKRFEDIRQGTLGSLAAELAHASVKGEICLLVQRGYGNVKEIDVESELKAALDSMSVRDAVDAVARAHDLPRRAVYKTALALTKGDE